MKIKCIITAMTFLCPFLKSYQKFKMYKKVIKKFNLI